MKHDIAQPLGIVTVTRPDDLREAADVYARELQSGRAASVALNYATAVYLNHHPLVLAGEARALIRAATGPDGSLKQILKI